MAGPRNNLDDVLKRRGLNSSSSATLASATSQSQDTSSKPKFRAATKPAVAAQPATVKSSVQKTSSYSSFSTPGFGKKKPVLSASSSSSVVEISSTETSPVFAQAKPSTVSAAAGSTPLAQMITSLPSKRSSPSTSRSSDYPAKRPRATVEESPSEKENFFDGEDEEPTQIISDLEDAPSTYSKNKGKGRERDPSWTRPPPATQRTVDFSTTTPSRQPTRTLLRNPALQPISRSGGPVNSGATSLRAASSSFASSRTAGNTQSSGVVDASRRTVTLDYSGLLEMSLEELLDAKQKILDVRSAMMELRDSLNRDVGNGSQAYMMLKDYDEQTQDRIKCINSLIDSRKSGLPPSLPPTQWATAIPTATSAATVPSLSSSSRYFAQPAADIPHPRDEPLPFEHFEPWGGPELPEEEPDMDYPIDVDPPYDPPSPVVIDSGGDSDDALWGQLAHEEDEVEVIAPPPAQPVASSSHDVSMSDLLRYSDVRTETESNKPDPELMKKSYYNDLVKVRDSVFKIKSWRKNQLEAICSVMDGNHTFNLMPTGGGKSLTFQLPAEVMHRRHRKTTVVVIPLVSLMEDQERALEKKGISNICFRGAKQDDEDEKKKSPQVREAERQRELEEDNERYRLLFSPQDRPALVYVTPEKISGSDRFRNSLLRLHREGNLFMVAIDEVHLISSWGKTFRDALADLDWLPQQLPGTPIMALTATANTQNRVDIMNTLHIQDCKQLIMSFNRPNLNYIVKAKAARTAIQDIAEFIKTHHPGESGIVYHQGREKCEKLAEKLVQISGISAMPYHAGLKPALKKRIQADWQSGKVKVVFATAAFGMGIDKEDVRFVIHYSIPSNLSGYYQETGRAGRDGKPSSCVLYYDYRDAHINRKRIIEDHKNDVARQAALDEMSRVIQYCLNITDCRRTQVLAFFDQAFPAEKCNRLCDNCRDLSPMQEIDMTEHAQNFIRLLQEVQRTKHHITRSTLIQCALGKNNPTVKDKNFTTLSTFGASRDLALGRAERLFDELEILGIVEPYMVCTGGGRGRDKFATEYTRLLPAGLDFLRRSKTVTVRFRDPPPKKARKVAKATQSGKQKGRTRKVTEIAEDPIEEEEDWGNPDPDDEVPTAGLSTRSSRQLQPPSAVIDLEKDDETNEVEDDDDDIIEILQPSSRARTRDDVMQECYRDLVARVDTLASTQEIANNELIPDGALQLISATLPEDVKELRANLAEDDIDMDFVEPFLPALIDVVLKHRANLPQNEAGPKPLAPAKSIGTRSKPPSISQLHNNYEFRQGGSMSSTKKWPPARVGK